METNASKNEKKKDKLLSRTRTRHFRFDAPILYHYTTEADNVAFGKSL